MIYPILSFECKDTEAIFMVNTAFGSMTSGESVLYGHMTAPECRNNGGSFELVLKEQSNPQYFYNPVLHERLLK